MTNQQTSLVDRLYSTPLRRAITTGVSGAALFILLVELFPETRAEVKNNLLFSLEAIQTGFITSYLADGARYAGSVINHAYQNFRSG